MSSSKQVNNFEKKIEDFFGFDLRSIALYRIFIGLCVVFDLVVRYSDLKAHYTDLGILPTNVAKATLGNIYICIHCLNGSEWFQILLFLLTFIFALMLIFGYNSRIMAFLCWIMIISVQNRNVLILNVADYILKLSLFWSLFLPLGARWSIDSLLNSQKEKLNTVTSFGTVGYLIQTIIFFLFAGLLKLKNPEWVNGSALFFVLNQVQYTTRIGMLISQLPFDVLNMLSKLALKFELYGWLLFFIPYKTNLFRLFTVLSFILMVSMFGLCLDLETVHWFTIAAMIPLIPGFLWDKCNIKINSLNRLFLLIQNHVEKHKAFYLKFNLPLHGVKPSLYGNIIAFSLIVFVLQMNLATINEKYSYPNEYNILTKIFRVDQRWGMFIPNNKDGTWYGAWSTVVGYKNNREVIDLMYPNRKASIRRPEVPSESYKNHQWRRILSKTGRKEDIKVYPFISSYFCKNWNDNHTKEDQIEEVEYYFVYFLPELNREQPIPTKSVIWRRICKSNKDHADEFIKYMKEENFPEDKLLIAQEANSLLIKEKYKDALKIYEDLYDYFKNNIDEKSNLYLCTIKMLYRLYFATSDTGKFTWAKSVLDEITGNYVEGYYDDEEQFSDDYECFEEGDYCS